MDSTLLTTGVETVNYHPFRIYIDHFSSSGILSQLERQAPWAFNHFRKVGPRAALRVSSWLGGPVMQRSKRSSKGVGSYASSITKQHV